MCFCDHCLHVVFQIFLLGILGMTHRGDYLTKWKVCNSVGFLPGRNVFLPHEGEKQGRKYFCHSFCHLCRAERAELIKT